jgi:hypothetical protein
LAGGLAKVMEKWMTQDAYAAGNWMTQNRGQPGYDQVLQAYTRGLGASDPKAALTWAQGIGSDAQRDAVLQAIAANWLQNHGSEGAQQLLGYGFAQVTIDQACAQFQGAGFTGLGRSYGDALVTVTSGGILQPDVLLEPGSSDVFQSVRLALPQVPGSAVPNPQGGEGSILTRLDSTYRQATQAYYLQLQESLSPTAMEEGEMPVLANPRETTLTVDPNATDARVRLWRSGGRNPGLPVP